MSDVVDQKRRELNPFQMSYCWHIHTLASKALVPIPQSHGSICVGLSQSQRVPCSPWWRHPHNTTSINNYPSVRCDDEGISKIRVPDRNTSLFPRRHHPLYTRWYWCQFTPTTSVQFQWQGGRKPLWLSACFGPHRSFTISRHTYHFLVCPTPNTHSITIFLFKILLSLTRYSKFAGRVTIATRFQRAFMQLLSNAQFEELSARDLMLTSALNTDYLLTLPIYVDWKRAYESNAIIFRYFHTHCFCMFALSYWILYLWLSIFFLL